jgi:hypothetical protein
MLSIGILGFIVWSHLIEKADNQSASCLLCCTLFFAFPTRIYQQKKLMSSYFSRALYTNAFNFSSFINNYKFIDQSWLEWFVGFSEGDGSWTISNSRLFFIITQKEIAILYHIQETLGFGSVTTDAKGIGRYIVSNKDHILLLIYLFSGNIILSKRLIQFNNWVTSFNSIYGMDLHLQSKCLKLTLNSAWLAGFTDAEGCFNVNIVPRSPSVVGFRTTLRFVLDQQFEQEILLLIASLLGTGHVSCRASTNKVYRLTIDSFKHLPSLISYFSKFPLKSHKKISFSIWCVIYTKMLNKEHLGQPGFDQIKSLAKLMKKLTP